MCLPVSIDPGSLQGTKGKLDIRHLGKQEGSKQERMKQHPGAVQNPNSTGPHLPSFCPVVASLHTLPFPNTYFPFVFRRDEHGLQKSLCLSVNLC